MLRFRDRSGPKMVLRSISIGYDRDIAAKALTLLYSWQVARNPRKTLDANQRQFWARLDECAAALPLFRREYLQHHERAGNNPVKLLEAQASWPDKLRQLQKRRRGGRPRRGRLEWRIGDLSTT